MKKYTIAVAGIGYVGLSNAILLAQHHTVILTDIDEDRVQLILKKRSPVQDDYIMDYLGNTCLDLSATTKAEEAYARADFVVIATPTNYDEETGHFDTGSVESVIEKVLKINPAAAIIIKSTVPIGYTKEISVRFKANNILFSPEFLREGKALYDNLYPSRIVVGVPENNLPMLERAQLFAGLLQEGALKKEIPLLFTDLTEAEAIKLFANTYLALRVSFFNELDTYAMEKNLNTAQIIEGMCLDPRIGKGYNNPSFGYGGYCLPKDTKQLLADYQEIPQELIGGTVRSNARRKAYLAETVLGKLKESQKEVSSCIVGIYRLTMKAGSDNFRQSSVLDVMKWLSAQGVHILIYEPTIKEGSYGEYPVENDFDKFCEKSDLILANRSNPELDGKNCKLFTRDIYKEN